MNRALVWLQLRKLRGVLLWGGIGVCVLPWALAALGLGLEVLDAGGGFSLQDALLAVTPAVLGLFAWPLIGLAAGSITLAALREVEGSFLLAQPLARWRTWFVELGSAVAATATLVALSLVAWVLAVWLSGLGPRIEKAFGETPGYFLGGGSAMALAGILAAALLARFGVTGVPCLAAGFVIVAGQALAVLFLAARHALVSTLGFGILGGGSLLVGLVAAALMALPGEPAGRGARRRGVAAMLIGVALIAGSFAFAAPRYLAAQSDIHYPGATVSLAPDGRAALAFGGPLGGYWLIDTETGSRHFLPPPNFSHAWSPDSRHIALRTAGDAYGRHVSERIEIRDARSGELTGWVPWPRCSLRVRPRTMRWDGEVLVSVWDATRADQSCVAFTHPEGRRARAEFYLPHSDLLLGPRYHSQLLALTAKLRKQEPFALIGIHDKAHHASTHGVDAVAHGSSASRIAPGGRSWLRATGSGLAWHHLESGRVIAEVPPEAAGRWSWIGDERLAWIEGETLLARTPDSPTTSMALPAQCASEMLHGEPRGSRLILRCADGSTWLLDPDSRTNTRLDGWETPSPYWAGPATLGGRQDGRLVLLNLDEDEEPRPL